MHWVKNAAKAEAKPPTTAFMVTTLPENAQLPGCAAIWLLAFISRVLAQIPTLAVYLMSGPGGHGVGGVTQK